jgi:hypothetical protein
MQLFRILLFLLQFAYFIISTDSNQITIKNYDTGFNKTYYGNITLTCKNANTCNMTKIYCDTGNCYIEAIGHNKGQLNNLIIDARNIRKGYKFELKCGSQSQNSVGNTNCNNVKVLCPLHRGATCKCTNCNYREVKFYCELGIGVYCTGSRIVPSWNQNNIWCDGGHNYNPYGGYGGYGGSGKYICDDINWGMSSCEATYTNPAVSLSLYNFAPNDKCVAFQTSYYSSYYKEDYAQVTTHSCRETINASTNEYKYHLPICLKYISKPDNIPDLKQYFNITRIITKNKTNIINRTNWIDQQRINWINQTRIINKTVLIDRINWIDKELIRWINQTRIINKTVLIDRINWIDEIKIRIINETNIVNKTRWINQTNWKEKVVKKVSERINDNKENTTMFKLDLNNFYVLGGLSIGGLLVFTVTFYITWKCCLREKVENMIIAYFIGEDGKSCLESIEFFPKYFNYLKEIKEGKQDQKEYYGLTREQIEICKAAKVISKIKYEAALKVRWDKIAKKATRPDDPYHSSLFKYVIEPQRHSTIEMSELHKDIPTKDDDEEEEKTHIIQIEEGIHMPYEIKPGTPRRRRKSVLRVLI